ncbi:TetR/AcrR family transcriptional regulator [Dactylosporangium sp. CA-092794]|uniref:TetR/AcrR family transcriptional regulator n=1 Tax=Dactylosporangium sp. CA-092794 TaxID=3239929 RepID=UPI003D8EE2FE
MTNSESRASGMSPEQLREAIVQAVIPLIAEWDAVTNAQIAHAASIDEATLLHVFNDKNAVLIAAAQAHMMTALDPTQVVQELQSIPLDQPLAARLVETIHALDTYHGRIATLLAPLDAYGTPQGQPTPDSGTAGEPRTRPFSREDFRAAARMDVIGQAVTKLLEPDQEHLRLQAGTLANVFLALYSGRKRTPHPQPSQLSAEQLVDLFIHGALTTTNRA